MGRSKTQKFEDNIAAGNVLQPGHSMFELIKGNWNELYFKNESDIVLELACGRGEYTNGLAATYTHTNFIGIDIKGARIWRGSQMALKENQNNVAFLRANIQNLGQFFAEEEVAGIWIIHPDPRPKKSDERRRLTNNRFLDLYKQIIKPGGLLRFKTDNEELYKYSLEVLEKRTDIDIVSQTPDLYASDLLEEHHDIKTHYETLFSKEGYRIKYIKFCFR